jgi:Xaa-Pro aminopeptidase
MSAKNRPDIFSQRVQTLRERVKTAGASGLVDAHLPNVHYLTGFTGSAGMFLLTPHDAILFTDSRYRIQAREEVRGGVEVRIESVRLHSAAGNALRGRRRLPIIYSPEHTSVEQRHELAKAAGAGVRWMAVNGVVEELRSIKDEVEIAIMREAARLAEEALAETLALVKPGVEENELAAEIEYRMRRKGASGAAFATIVASGEHAALPHAQPSRKRIRKNELVVFDLGAILRGYCSDLTRTVHVGRASARVKEWYRAVLEAQQAARAALRPGANGAMVDAAARGRLRRSGLARYFSHSTGHGLGREVHEIPRLARHSRSVMRAGQVVTLEPGIYIEGVGGIRIEDDIVVRENGTESLTQLNRELMEL